VTAEDTFQNMVTTLQALIGVKQIVFCRFIARNVDFFSSKFFAVMANETFDLLPTSAVFERHVCFCCKAACFLQRALVSAAFTSKDVNE